MKDIEKLIEAKAATDPRLKAIIKKIGSGTATFRDTAEYSEIYSELLGRSFSAEVLSLADEDRERVCISLLRGSYEDINDLLSQVQTSLDAAAGIHISPQKAPFPAERVKQIAHSLRDITVPDETIIRRARSASNVSKSFHDDYIKQNAKFRNNAGLKCYINRETDGSCCQWCSDIAGRYAYGTEPEDVYRRHDNCGCTVTFENGRERQDVWSKRTWEAPETGEGAPSPTVLSEEEGKAIEQRNLQYKGLTNGSDSDKIRNIKIDDIYSAIEGGKISDDVAKVIFDTLNEDNSQHLFDNVAVIKTESNIVMQTDPVKKGTFFDTCLNLNENFLGGKTLEQIDEEIKNSKVTVCNSLREAVIHEKYHAKLINGLNQSELNALYEELSEYNITGISPTAYKDGTECIAEIGVLFERGETKNIPEKARKLFNERIGGIL